MLAFRTVTYCTENEETPFQAFRGANTDPVFYNINSGAAQVALGYAIAKFRGMFGLWVETSGRLTQTQSKSGGLLKKKITTTTIGYAKPTFYAAVPLEMSGLLPVPLTPT